MDLLLGFRRVLPDIIEVIRLSAFAIIRAIFADPSLLLRPRDIRRLVMAEAWKSFGPGIDGNSKEVKQKLITPHARGVVLDIGAGESVHRPVSLGESLLSIVLLLTDHAL